MEITNDENIIKQLRRLKIEEDHLTKIIVKIRKYSPDDSGHFLNFNISSGFIKYCTKIKKSIIEVKSLFEDIKVNTIRQENLQVVDIDDVKRDVIELETKIKSLKSYLQSELTTLKKQEQYLEDDLNDDVNAADKLKKKPRIQATPFKEIVPSPVKKLINSPLKCPEVREFQEFLMHSKNKYGGWILYNHNIFIKTWEKHFCNDTFRDLNSQEPRDVNDVENSTFQYFIRELCRKIPGLTTKDVVAHHIWYSKYIYLKDRQQKALDKWRANKKIIKKAHFKIQMKPNSSNVSKLLIEKRDANISKNRNRETLLAGSGHINRDLLNIIYDNNKLRQESNVTIYSTLKVANVEDDSSSSQTRIEAKGKQLGFLRPTKQWNNRCNGSSDTKGFTQNINNVESINKLYIPRWRLYLQE